WHPANAGNPKVHRGVGLYVPTSTVMPGAPATPAGASVTSVAVVGDSLAVGLDPALGERARDAGLVYVARPVGGTSVGSWLAGHEAPILAQVLSARPGYVIVSLGTNDMLLADPARAGTRGGDLADRIAATGAVVLWILPPTL